MSQAERQPIPLDAKYYGNLFTAAIEQINTLSGKINAVDRVRIQQKVARYAEHHLVQFPEGMEIKQSLKKKYLEKSNDETASYMERSQADEALRLLGIPTTLIFGRTFEV